MQMHRVCPEIALRLKLLQECRLKLMQLNQIQQPAQSAMLRVENETQDHKAKSF